MTFTTVDDIGPIVGLIEIGLLTGTSPRTPHQWWARNLLPPADYASINGSRAWKRTTIEKWARRTGRMGAPGEPTIVRNGGRPNTKVTR